MANVEVSVVVIEDDHHISDLVTMYLRRDGFRVVQADDAERGLSAIDRESPSLVIVDIGLPGQMDGLEVCKRLVAATPPVPVLILSARDDEVDRILGLELGADDYVTKPFSARELVARVHAVLRRTSVPVAGYGITVIEFGTVAIDTGRREASLGGEVVPLATREFDLLAFLIDNQGLALSRQQLLDGVWGPDWFGDERTVDVHVGQLRKKLGADLPLATVWGIGYRLG
jgi:DNA-binding response OmpR family regulator